jgi:hypothetical protein
MEVARLEAPGGGSARSVPKRADAGMDPAAKATLVAAVSSIALGRASKNERERVCVCVCEREREREEEREEGLVWGGKLGARGTTSLYVSEA